MSKNKRSAKVPTSATAKRLAAIMHRRSTSVWNEKKEITPFRLLSSFITEEDLQLTERYYKANWPPRTFINHLRHDLATLINNWSGEVDRARIWCEAHPIKHPVRKIIPLPMPAESRLSDVELAQFSEDYEKLTGRKWRNS